ncbi:hypothetical protein Q5P01_018975 [Channa striata]|uniref:G-protein coupled receptors family 1 profile domain-containing protein n=1 Tax=Channa striata TaxID=64152 RepID=A0AA88M0L6_CHASR|nr:hypothetical protein Q5P01_018975 [Channa striata]
MYLLFCNLSVNDVMGNSLLVPRLLSDILVPPSERLIHYYECVVQAFTTHMFNTASHTVLMIMAFDRYVAICNPLQYAAVMTGKMVIKLTVSAWGSAFILVVILLSLTLRLNRCRTLITNPYCDNASLFKLSCDDVFLTNVYGLTFTVVLLSSSMGSIILTYSKITAACLANKSKSMNSKALKTCGTHLCLYLIMHISGLVFVILHRFPQYSDYRKISAILFHIVPSSLNPVIYGLQSQEIQKSVLLLPPISSSVRLPAEVEWSFCHFMFHLKVQETLTDLKLSSPMYFFLSNLSFVEIVYTTTTIPKMLSSFLSDLTTISVPGCFLQMFLFIQLGSTGHAILTVMAFDRYMAICKPLHYTSIMTQRVQLLLILGGLSFSALCTLPAAIVTWQEPYCGPNVVRHAWCDPSSVRRLACADTSVDNMVSLFLAVVALLTTGVLILTSYVLIGVSMSRMGVTQRLKAFRTCAAHLTVVTISYSSASFVYISYRVGNFSPEVRISVAVLYSILIPFLNPVIYSLRNKELQDSIRRTESVWVCCCFSHKGC